MPNSADNTGINVSLKKFVESKIASLKELLNEKLKGRDDALKLQADEYERRLEDLNHEYQRNKDRNAEFPSAEKFDSLQTEFLKYKESNDKIIVVREKFESFEREFRQYKESNDRAVDAKAKAIADQVEQKAIAATNAVDQKATALAKEFVEYKTSQATAVALAAGRSSIADPEMSRFMDGMRAMQKATNEQALTTAGGQKKMSNLKAAVYAGVGVFASLVWVVSLAVNIYMAFHGR